MYSIDTMFHCVIIIFHDGLIYLLSLASRGGVSQTIKTSDTVQIVAQIFYVYIMVKTAWKARLHLHKIYYVP